MPDLLQTSPHHFPLLGNSLVIGLAALMHIALASLAVGFMVLAPIAEALEAARPWGLSAAHAMTRFTLVTYTASLVLAVIMVELIIGLFPLTNAWLFNRFRYPILLGAGAFLVQLLLLYPYYHYWQPLRAWSRRGHVLLGALAALCMLVWVAMLDGMGSYMLTPSSGRGPWAPLRNPTWLPLVLHRFIGNFVVAGYVVAGYAAWRLGRVPPTEAPLYQGLLKSGFFLGLLALLLQPLAGLVYATAIAEAAPQAYHQLIRGPYRPLLYGQFMLVGLLFLGSHLWLRAAFAGMPAWPRFAALLAVLGMVASAGHVGLRRFFTFVLVAVTVLAWRAARRPGPQGPLPPTLSGPAVRRLSVMLGLTAVLTYLTMGTIRETARRPDTVRGLISLEEEAAAPAADRTRDASPQDGTGRRSR